MLNFKKITAAAVCCVLFTAFASGCGDDTSGSSEKGSGSEASSASSTQTEAGKVLNFTAPEKGEEIAVLTIKDYGDIKIKLFPEEAEKGVENFTGLAKDGYYDNLIFHRVINDFRAAIRWETVPAENPFGAISLTEELPKILSIPQGLWLMQTAEVLQQTAVSFI